MKVRYTIFRTSNYVQQRKTYTTKAAMVYLYYYNLHNTLCARIAAAVCYNLHNTLCTRITAAVWRKSRDVICEVRGTRLLYVIPSCKTYPCQNTCCWFIPRHRRCCCSLVQLLFSCLSESLHALCYCTLPLPSMNYIVLFILSISEQRRVDYWLFLFVLWRAFTPLDAARVFVFILPPSPPPPPP
jgi:hypothetical protein